MRLRLKSLFASAVCLLCLQAGNQAQADGFGWWYSSFSIEGFSQYFGNGSLAQKRLAISQMREIVARERADPFVFEVPHDPSFDDLWERSISNGICYSGLSEESARHLDKIISIAFSSDKGDTDLAKRLLGSDAETEYYLTVHTIKAIKDHLGADNAGHIDLFRNGRSYGSPSPRPKCLYKKHPRDWGCYEAYFILMPHEAKQMADMIRNEVMILQLDKDSRTEIDSLFGALTRASLAQRGLYFIAHD